MLSLALLPGLTSAALTLTLTPDSNGISLNADIELLEDSSAQLGIADMAAPATCQWPRQCWPEHQPLVDQGNLAAHGRRTKTMVVGNQLGHPT